MMAEMRKMNEHFQFRFWAKIQNLNCCFHSKFLLATFRWLVWRLVPITRKVTGEFSRNI